MVSVQVDGSAIVRLDVASGMVELVARRSLTEGDEITIDAAGHGHAAIMLRQVCQTELFFSRVKYHLHLSKLGPDSPRTSWSRHDLWKRSCCRTSGDSWRLTPAMRGRRRCGRGSGRRY